MEFRAQPIRIECRAPPRALVVDDDTASRVLLCMVLEDLGYGVIEAPNGETALSLWRKVPVDLVITDVHMPGLSGLEVTGAIRREERRAGRRLPIIGYTADVHPAGLSACRDSGMDEVLTKPFRFRDLEALLVRSHVAYTQERLGRWEPQ